MILTLTASLAVAQIVIRPLPPIILTNVLINPGFETGSTAPWTTPGGTVSYAPYVSGPLATAAYAGYVAEATGYTLPKAHGGSRAFYLNPNPPVPGQPYTSHSMLRQTLAKPVSGNRVFDASVWTFGQQGWVTATIRYTDGSSRSVGHACVTTSQQPWERWSFADALDSTRNVASVEFVTDTNWLVGLSGHVPPILVDDASLTIIGKP